MLRNITSIMLCFALLACSSGEKSKSGAQTKDDEHPLELALPQVPDTITEPADRAAYIMMYFWDTLQFTDTIKSLDKDFVEQNFSNFISLFPIARTVNQRVAVKKLMHLAKADNKVYDLFVETARKYLYEPNSPMYNEEIYRLFVENVLADSVASEAQVERLKVEHEWMSVNSVGSVATDFSYRTADGKTSSLLRTPISDQLMLVMYDPTCDHCQDVINALGEDPKIKSNIKSGKLKVLAVNLDGHNPSLNLPEGWLDVADTGGIRDHELYIIRATPAIYLIDADHRITDKDVPPTSIISFPNPNG